MGPPLDRLSREQELMLHRVREVLLVSSSYDAFVLQEDGHLTEQIFLEYKELSLSSAPHFTHVTTTRAALDMLGQRHFDMVLIVSRSATPDLVKFGRAVKQHQGGMPVVVLGFESSDLSRLKKLVSPEAIDSLFIWNGDAKILLAIIKHIEDRLNVEADIATASVRVILVVEDSVRFSSTFLATLYPELMRQSQSLFSEGQNLLRKLLRMRTRPKILHATSFEQAVELFERYRDSLLAVLSDIGFPHRGQMDEEAGLALVKVIREVFPDLPVLLQSSDPAFAGRAAQLHTLFVDKNSPALLYSLRHFLTEYLGFGPFVFRLPDDREVARARDVRELAACIRTVPAASLEYHARRNHFSNWLLARSEFDLAARLQPRTVGEFESIEELRRFVLDALEESLRQAGRGVIADYGNRTFDGISLFQRIGEGSLGGKARGIAFLNQLLDSEPIGGQLAGLRTQIPQTFALATNAFVRFLEQNGLFPFLATRPSDEAILQRFLDASLPEEVQRLLGSLVDYVEGPLAVRSSSLLEDDMLHPFAGIYGTVMIPNDSPDPAERLADLRRAIRTVYATTFFRNARAYLENTGHSVEEEKMAIIIQRLVGQIHGRRFYPHVAGVAHSYNYYPMGPLKADEGVVQAVLGLGRMVVEGGEAVRFCPRHPGVIPQFATTALTQKNSQRRFYALDLDRSWHDPGMDYSANLVLHDLSEAQADGTFRFCGSVYDAQSDVITESPAAQGPLVITLNNILKHKTIPLAQALSEMLKAVSEAMDTPVELEFAVDMGDLGRHRPPASPPRPPVLYVLQVRPILIREALVEMPEQDFPEDQIICRTTRALGNGSLGHIQDVIYVKHNSFEPAQSPTIATQVGELNTRLTREMRPYVLIGPGRWGSSDHWLGIPVQWSQINGARIIVEASPEGFNVEPSQGSHFFHNITSLRLGYFTIPAGAHKQPGADSFVDWEFLERLPAISETQYLRHVRVEETVVAHLDGRRGLGIIAWCRPRDADTLCQSDSS